VCEVAKERLRNRGHQMAASSSWKPYRSSMRLISEESRGIKGKIATEKRLKMGEGEMVATS